MGILTRLSPTIFPSGDLRTVGFLCSAVLKGNSMAAGRAKMPSTVTVEALTRVLSATLPPEGMAKAKAGGPWLEVPGARVCRCVWPVRYRAVFLALLSPEETVLLTYMCRPMGITRGCFARLADQEERHPGLLGCSPSMLFLAAGPRSFCVSHPGRLTKEMGKSSEPRCNTRTYVLPVSECAVAYGRTWGGTPGAFFLLHCEWNHVS
jgi:hypothetical protein